MHRTILEEMLNMRQRFRGAYPNCCVMWRINQKLFDFIQKQDQESPHWIEGETLLGWPFVIDNTLSTVALVRTPINSQPVNWLAEGF